ncbi:hypothetical protein STEG23_013259, partial [Scotinomys teguina]
MLGPLQEQQALVTSPLPSVSDEGCPSTEEWIKKIWYIHTMEYYSAEENNDIMKCTDEWMELENIILSEIFPGICVMHLLSSVKMPLLTLRKIQ